MIECDDRQDSQLKSKWVGWSMKLGDVVLCFETGGRAVPWTGIDETRDWNVERMLLMERQRIAKEAVTNVPRSKEKI